MFAIPRKADWMRSVAMPRASEIQVGAAAMGRRPVIPALTRIVASALAPGERRRQQGREGQRQNPRAKHKAGRDEREDAGDHRLFIKSHGRGPNQQIAIP